jgi:hypothetical protein
MNLIYLPARSSSVLTRLPIPATTVVAACAAQDQSCQSFAILENIDKIPDNVGEIPQAPTDWKSYGF